MGSVHCHLSICVKCNAQNLRPIKYIHLYYLTAQRPFDEINVDLTGGYKVTKNGNKFAVTAIDEP